MDRLNDILSSIDLEEQKNEVKEEYVDDWYCNDCEHGPMTESDNKCTRCGAKNSQYHGEEEMTGWEDEDIESEVEEIW
jgi:rubrerythrin